MQPIVLVIWGSKYSHAKDLYGRGQPQGTCLLLEVLSLDSFVHYFQSIHNNDIFEVRGVQIENIQNRMVSQNSVNEPQTSI